jgi:hypothetical protein
MWPSELFSQDQAAPSWESVMGVLQEAGMGPVCLLSTFRGMSVRCRRLGPLAKSRLIQLVAWPIRGVEEELS